MKGKSGADMIQSAIRLPRKLHERLKKAGGQRGMGQEVRQRLEASFDAERTATHPKTMYLLNAISACADKIERDYGNWSEDAFAFEVLKGCANILFMHFKPTGEPIPKPKPGSLAATLFGPSEPKPEEASRLYVHSWISLGAKRQEEEKRR